MEVLPELVTTDVTVGALRYTVDLAIGDQYMQLKYVAELTVRYANMRKGIVIPGFVSRIPGSMIVQRRDTHGRL
jgi:hypothetical protein